MFRWFERRLDPFPPEEPVEPPKTLVAFCLHYTRGAWPYIAGAGDADHGDRARRSVDVRLPRATIVDWLSVQNRETFLQTEGWKLAGMAFVVRVRCCPARCCCIRCSTSRR